MASGVPRPARGQGEPQPFTHLSVPNADLYRSLLRTFARAKERFIVHLRPEDVAAELRIDADEQLTQALEQLVVWGNLRADVDTSRVTTVEDFHRKRSLYQLTAAGQAAEQAIAFYEEAIGRRGQLQSVALADIADRLRSLQVLAADPDPDPAKVHLLLLSVAERFSSLADNAQAFMSALRRAIDFSDGDVDGFLAYKERLIDYINRFIADLANSGAQIAVLLGDLEAAGHERLLELAARREAADAVPEGADAAESLAQGGETGARRVAEPVARAGRLVHVAGRGPPVAGPAAAAGCRDRDQAAHRRGGPAQRAALGAVGSLGGLPGARPVVRRGAGRRGRPPPVAGGVRPVSRPAPVRHQRDRRRLARPSTRNGVAGRTAHPHLPAAQEDREPTSGAASPTRCGTGRRSGSSCAGRPNARRPRPPRPGDASAPPGRRCCPSSACWTPGRSGCSWRCSATRWRPACPVTPR